MRPLLLPLAPAWPPNFTPRFSRALAFAPAPRRHRRGWLTLRASHTPCVTRRTPCAPCYFPWPLPGYLVLPRAFPVPMLSPPPRAATGAAGTCFSLGAPRAPRRYPWPPLGNLILPHAFPVPMLSPPPCAATGAAGTCFSLRAPRAPRRYPWPPLGNLILPRAFPALTLLPSPHAATGVAGT